MSEIIVYSEIYQAEVAKLILAIQSVEFEIPITLKDQPDLIDIKNFYQKNNGNFWVAIMENKVIGTIALLDIGNGLGVLRKMFVNKEYRGRDFGLGQKLMDTLGEWAKQKHYKEILLGTTEKFIAAQRFYQRNGFVRIEKERLPSEFPVMKVDVVFYKKILID